MRETTLETTLACALFSTRTLLREEHNAKHQFSALQYKDRLRDLCNYLNQKVKIAINTLEGSILGDNLITSHQVDACPQRSFQLKLLKITKVFCSKR